MAGIVAGACALAGALLMFLAGIGVLRFRDLYSRMHAATKATTLGLGLIGISAAILIDAGWPKVTLAVLLVFVTAPAAAHFVGRAAYRAEGVDISLSGRDDFRSLVDDSGD